MTAHDTCVPIEELRRLADFHDDQHPVTFPACSICYDRLKGLETQERMHGDN